MGKEYKMIPKTIFPFEGMVQPLKNMEFWVFSQCKKYTIYNSFIVELKQANAKYMSVILSGSVE